MNKATFFFGGGRGVNARAIIGAQHSMQSILNLFPRRTWKVAATDLRQCNRENTTTTPGAAKRSPSVGLREN